MKRNSNLIKTLIITFLVIVLLSCFVKTSMVSGTTITVKEVNSVGLIGFAQVFFNSVISNIDALVLIVMIGIMYGVLNKTNAYQDLISLIAKKFKNKEKVLLVISTVFFALISSIMGLQIELFIFIPFITAIIMFCGYDKKISFAATFGAIIVGMIGATFNTLILGGINAYYNIAYTSQIAIKALILLVALFLYITNILKHASISTEEVEYLEIPNYEEVKSTNRKKLPVVLYILIISILIIIGTFKLGDVIGIELFANLKDTLSDITIIKNIFGELPVFSKLGYVDLAYMIFIGTLLIGFIYSVKFNDLIDGMFKGASRVLPAAVVMLCVMSVPVICANYPFYLTIVNSIVSHFKDFNIFISSIAVFITSIFVPTSSGVVSILPVVNATMDADINVMTLIAQTISGLAMLIAPTSFLLMFGLSYDGVKYTDWIKFIFKTFLYVLVILFAIFLIIIML